MEVGRVKNNKHKFVMTQLKDRIISNDELLVVANKILTQHYKAFKELAK